MNQLDNQLGQANQLAEIKAGRLPKLTTPQLAALWLCSNDTIQPSDITLPGYLATKRAVGTNSYVALIDRGLITTAQIEIGTWRGARRHYLTDAGRALINILLAQAETEARTEFCSRHGLPRAGEGCERCNAAEATISTTDRALMEAAAAFLGFDLDGAVAIPAADREAYAAQVRAWRSRHYIGATFTSMLSSDHDLALAMNRSHDQAIVDAAADPLGKLVDDSWERGADAAGGDWSTLAIIETTDAERIAARAEVNQLDAWRKRVRAANPDKPGDIESLYEYDHAAALVEAFDRAVNAYGVTHARGNMSDAQRWASGWFAAEREAMAEVRRAWVAILRAPGVEYHGIVPTAGELIVEQDWRDAIDEQVRRRASEPVTRRMCVLARVSMAPVFTPNGDEGTVTMVAKGGALGSDRVYVETGGGAEDVSGWYEFSELTPSRDLVRLAMIEIDGRRK